MVIRWGHELRKYRAAVEFTQEDAAQVCDVHVQTWSKWERGVRVPGKGAKAQILRTFDLSGYGSSELANRLRHG